MLSLQWKSLLCMVCENIVTCSVCWIVQTTPSNCFSLSLSVILIRLGSCVFNYSCLVAGPKIFHVVVGCTKYMCGFSMNILILLTR